MTEREQFTFYKSFYLGMRRITDKAARADLYDCLCQYALYQQIPDLDNMVPEATLLFELSKPVLDAAWEKAQNGSIGKNKPKSKQNQTGNKTKSKQNQKGNKKEKEVEKEKEIEIEIENEIEHECVAAFDRFWDAYPRRVNEAAARAAFCDVGVSLDVLLPALERQKNSPQWQESGGRFVPYPATWLKNRLWEDPMDGGGPQVPKGCGPMMEQEFGDIAKQMDM